MNKWIYIILAVFLGGFGAHKLYAGKPFMFLLYLCFCWTFIPACVALIEAFVALVAWD